MGTIHATKSGLTYHNLAGATLEEVAAYVRLRPVATPGELYLRKQRDPDSNANKDFYSRFPVYKLWRELPGTLRILTMPGLKWQLERRILDWRVKRGLKTQITAVERDHAIFRLALHWMPSEGYKWKKGELQVMDDKSVKSDVAWYEQREVEDVIANTDWKWDGAWLDWNGQLTEAKLFALKTLWPRLGHSLVVTVRGSRQEPTLTRKLASAGGYGPFMAKFLGVDPRQVGEDGYLSGHARFWQVTVMKKGKAVEHGLRFINGIRIDQLLNGKPARPVS